MNRRRTRKYYRKVRLNSVEPELPAKALQRFYLHARGANMSIYDVFEYTIYDLRVNKAFYNPEMVTGTVFYNYINKCKGNFTQVAAGWF